MILKYQIKTAIGSLKGNRSRTLLTILGIVIGITSIILVMAIGRGAQSFILGEIESLGGNFVQINPGKQPKGPQDIADMLFSDSIKDRDLEALKNKANVPDLMDITPSFLVPGRASYGGKLYGATTVGWTADWIGKLYDTYPAEGNFFDDNDIRSAASVAVIGAKVKEELFGNTDKVIGEKIKIKDRLFRIVGILPERGKVSFMDVDKFIIIPYTTAQKYLLGINYYQELHLMATNETAVPNMVEDIKRTLRMMHNIESGQEDDFYVTTQSSMIDSVKSITTILTALLVSIAAISLVVGGVGIMNIMLVAVTERTREIGLRKALGATKKNIMVQFLIEAVILTGIGGVIGIIFGGLLSLAAAAVLQQVAGLGLENFSFPVSAAALGIFVSTAVGLTFGLYPAKKAAEKSPVEALRYE